jgi:tetratricopeptide (TPR) repeat protein
MATGTPGDIDKAIEYYREAIGIDHEENAVLLGNLAWALMQRSNDVVEPIELYRKVIKLALGTDPGLPWYANQLRLLLSNRDDPADYEEAIGLGRLACRLTSDKKPQLSSYALGLALLLFKRAGPADLVESLEYCRAVLRNARKR